MICSAEIYLFNATVSYFDISWSLESPWACCQNFSAQRNAAKGWPVGAGSRSAFRVWFHQFSICIFALGTEIQIAIAEAKVGEYDGHAIPADGSEGRYFVNGPDAEAIFKVIAPVLEASLRSCAALRSHCISAHPAGELPNESSSFRIRSRVSTAGLKPVGLGTCKN